MSKPKAAKKAADTSNKKTPRRESMADELARLRRELKARDEHDRLTRKLASEVEACELDVEAAAQKRGAAKEALAAANQRLAAHVRGGAPRDVETGKQQTIVDEKPKGKVDKLVDPRRDGREACAAGKKIDANPFPTVHPSHGLWSAGFLEESWKDAERRVAATYGLNYSALMDALPEVDGLPPGEAAPKVRHITAIEFPWMVVDAWRGSSKDDASFALVQLCKKDEWRDLWQKTYGPPCPGVDANDEAKAQRQAGGIDCGRIVKLEGQRGDYVVCPRGHACMVITVPAKVANEAMKTGAAVPDAKSAAANDDADHDDDAGDDE